MIVDEIRGAIATTAVGPDLDRLASALWGEYGQGRLTFEDTESLTDEIEARRAVLRAPRPSAPAGSTGHSSRFPPRRVQRSPDRARSIARRRGLAASGYLPGRLAQEFTTSENAALGIIAEQHLTKGRCVLSLDEIAARAGTCRTVVQNALRHAKRLELLVVEERRRPGDRNLPNVVRLISREWLSWLSRRPRPARGSGFRKIDPTNTNVPGERSRESHEHGSQAIHDPPEIHSQGSQRRLRV